MRAGAALVLDGRRPCARQSRCRPEPRVDLNMATAPAGSPATPPGAEQARQLELLQEALSRQHNVFHSVLESISDGVAVANADGQIIHFNAAAVRLLGLGASATPVDDWSNRYGCYLPDTATGRTTTSTPAAGRRWGWGATPTRVAAWPTR